VFSLPRCHGLCGSQKYTSIPVSIVICDWKASSSVFLMHAFLGKCWSLGELTEMLLAAGFDRVSRRDTAADRSAVLAHEPI